MKFTEFKLNEKTLKGLKFHEFIEATPIQEKMIPHILKGRNVIGQAKTGSGKTLAFGIPIIERINENRPEIQAIIITPTRELAKQIAEEISRAAKFTRVKTMTIYGGVSFQNQVNQIRRGAQVVVGTPGRLLDHLTKGLKIRPKIIVLDEADKMFEMGFFDDVSYILKLIRGQGNQQFMFFGATIPDETISLSRRYMKDPVMITIRKQHEERIPSSIKQFYYVVAESSDKINHLIHIIKNLEDNNTGNKKLKILIFVKTRVATRKLTNNLYGLGFRSKFINSDLSQAAREKTLEEFQNKGMILVATDVVSRGIDIDNVTCVINYDMPNEIQNYLHRIGRTGRMGKEGLAYTFVSLDEHPLIFQIEQEFKTKIKKKILHYGQGRY
ncbi:MAG: DEAD/DEAH box helicase [Candidatus Helarchaeota archaeon]|nr:DEAD/DEAH box helicase [Candidatus Helarchaeota archaeon]